MDDPEDEPSEDPYNVNVGSKAVEILVDQQEV